MPRVWRKNQGPHVGDFRGGRQTGGGGREGKKKGENSRFLRLLSPYSTWYSSTYDSQGQRQERGEIIKSRGKGVRYLS